MTILDDLQTQATNFAAFLTQALNTLNNVDLKLDDVKARIDALLSGGTLTPEQTAQIKAISATLTDAQTEASAVSDEADKLLTESGTLA